MVHTILVVLCNEYHHWPLIGFPFSDHENIGKPRAELYGNKRSLRCEGQRRDVDMRGTLRDWNDECGDESEGITDK